MCKAAFCHSKVEILEERALLWGQIQVNRVWPADPGGDPPPLLGPSVQSWVLSATKRRSCWGGSSTGQQRWLRGWGISLWRRDGGSGAVESGEDWQGISLMRKYLKGGCQEDGASSGMRSTGHKRNHKQVSPPPVEELLHTEGGRARNRLPREVMGSPSLRTCQTHPIPVGCGNPAGDQQRCPRGGAAAAARSLRQVAGAARAGPAAAAGSGQRLWGAGPEPRPARRCPAALLAHRCPAAAGLGAESPARPHLPGAPRCARQAVLRPPASRSGKGEPAWRSPWEHLPPAAARRARLRLNWLLLRDKTKSN